MARGGPWAEDVPTGFGEPAASEGSVGRERDGDEGLEEPHDGQSQQSLLKWWMPLNASVECGSSGLGGKV